MCGGSRDDTGTCEAAQSPGKRMESVCVYCLVFKTGGILGTRATTQCTVWISRCFLVSPGRFCERGMMCIVRRERFSDERRPVFIAGVRPSAMVMKAAPQPRSSTPESCLQCLCTSLLMCLH